MHLSRLFWKPSWNIYSKHFPDCFQNSRGHAWTHFWIYIRKPHVFFSLLATTGAASIRQMRRVSFVFFEKCVFLSYGHKITKVKHMVWRSNLFFTTVLKPFVKYEFTTFFTTVLKTVVNYVFNPSFTIVWIYIRTPQFFSTICEFGSRQVASDAASFVRIVWNNNAFRIATILQR